jgi:phage shock protein C
MFDSGLYRSRSGKILGVIQGLANHFDFNVFWLRVFAVILVCMSGIWPVVILYFLAGFMMKPEPVIPIANLEEDDFYSSYVRSRSGATRRLKRHFENLDRRIQRMEHVVTDSEFEWEQRLNS